MPPTAATLPPLPTLTEDRSRSLVSELLRSNAGCELPCWWGFEPGQTDWVSAEHFFRSFGTGPNTAGPYTVPDRSGGSYTFTYFQFTFEVPGERWDLVIDVAVVDGIIDNIHVSASGTHLGYSLSSLLVHFGEPDEVFLYTSPEPVGDGVLPFLFELLYSQRGVLVSFDKQGTLTQGQVWACINHYDRPSLSLWSPVHSHISPRPEPGDPLPNEWISLPQAAGISVSDFSHRFIDPVSPACVWTPSGIWH